MLLQDAKSKEQVETALEAGDDELREDIEEILDEVKRRWDRSSGYDEDYDPIDMKDIVEHDDFIDLVIHESPSRYELSQIPREEVESALRYAVTHETRGRGYSHATQYGPFYIDDRGGGHFSYKMEVGGNYTLPGKWFPKNAEFIPSDLAKEFWESLGPSYEWNDTSSVDRNEDYYGHGPGSDAYVEAGEDSFNEWCRDLISSYVSQSVRKEPEKAKEIFFNGVAEEDKALAEKLKSAGLPDEEILDFATSWFESDDDREGVLKTLRDYFDALESGTGETHEIIAEFSKQDIVDTGIKKGTLFENAPWKLIKLRPGDLRLEGTLMGHCVGDKGMGYVRAVKDGEIEIWSLRSRDNKPRFTLEVDGQFYDADDRAVAQAAAVKRGRTATMVGDPVAFAEQALRAQAIKQLKGKANRTPGFADVRRTGGIKFPDEVIFWVNALKQLGADPLEVQDFSAAWSPYPPPPAGARGRMQPNAGEVCTGFDLPYRPIAVRPNRRTSKRRTSRR
jgi:hypothetical protein